MRINGHNKMPEGYAPSRIMELLEIDGGWMTTPQMLAEFAHRWPDTTPTVVLRAFFRVAQRDDLVESDLFVADALVRPLRRIRALAT